MKKLLLLILLFINSHSTQLDNLLKEYENNSKMRNKTIDENIGHLRVYTQEHIKKMQYNKLSDLLKELRLLNYETNRYGTKTLLNTGFKASVSTSVKLFINNHEISSLYTLSAFSLWENIPLDFISHIEVYNGNSSFSVGSEPGANYIKIYTLEPEKSNGTKLNTSITDDKDRSLGITQTNLLENDWSYLFYAGIQKNLDEKTYSNSTLYNNNISKYLFLNLNKEERKIDIAFTKVTKDNFMGYSADSIPDDGEMESEDYYISYKDSFLEDKSLEAVLSFDVNERKYNEQNSDYGILFINSPTYNEKLKIKKYNLHLTKSYDVGNNKLLIGSDLIYKKRKNIYRLVNGTNINFNNFNKEETYSIFLEDKYKVNDNLHLSTNIKLDKYIRDDLENSNEKLLKIGAIYVPTENYGLKLFLAKSYIPPTYFYADYHDKSKSSLESQNIKYASLENVLKLNKHKFSFILARVIANDMVIFGANGFYNTDLEVEGNSYIINYDYELNDNNKLEINFYRTNTNQENTNSAEGGYIKLLGSHTKFDYFTSLVYKKGYNFLNTKIKDGYDLSLGTTYNINRNFNISFKAENILNKAIKNSYMNYLQGSSFALENQSRTYTISLEWLF